MRGLCCFFLLGLSFYVCVGTARVSTPVTDAVHKGHAVGHEEDGLIAVRAALASGGNVNEQDEVGWTPLMWAALECRPQILELLLNKGADVNMRANTDKVDPYRASGQTAIQIASGCFIARKRAELAPERQMPPDYIRYELGAPARMVKALLAHGANPNDADSGGRTCLMMAAMQGWSRTVDALLAAHAAVNARDKESRIAIDYVDSEDEATRKALASAGSKKPTGNSGRTVCDIQKALKASIMDCIDGRDIRNGLTKFQKEHGLSPTGELDPKTRAVLGIR